MKENLLTQSGQVTVNTTDDTAKGGNSVTPPPKIIVL